MVRGLPLSQPHHASAKGVTLSTAGAWSGVCVDASVVMGTIEEAVTAGKELVAAAAPGRRWSFAAINSVAVAAAVASAGCGAACCKLRFQLGDALFHGVELAQDRGVVRAGCNVASGARVGVNLRGTSLRLRGGRCKERKGKPRASTIRVRRCRHTTRERISDMGNPLGPALFSADTSAWNFQHRACGQNGG